MPVPEIVSEEEVWTRIQLVENVETGIEWLTFALEEKGSDPSGVLGCCIFDSLWCEEARRYLVKSREETYLLPH